DECQQLIENTQQKDPVILSTLFRNMHTIKGNARTFGLAFITDTLHEAEHTYDLLRKNQTKPWDQAMLMEQLHQARDCLKTYNDIYLQKLKAFHEDRRQTAIDPDLLKKIWDLANRKEISELEILLRAMETETLENILGVIRASLPSIANSLGKETP
ncbi:MAG: Hpt domain-containing protein, partial [SAR324 cluster bacterium]|nr:Hpt domain-containing protein [SAR324 cluster bacterium]